jgi:Na+/phosphate symporter
MATILGSQGDAMAAAQGGQDFQDRLKELCPLVDNLRLMLEAARHAFNRHSLPQLEKMAELHKNFTLDIDPFFEEVEAGLKDSSAAGQTQFLKLQNILTHLELMADKIAGLADHLRYKANHGIILSEEDLFVVNTIFSQLTGFMQALVDIFLVNDSSLKAYSLQTSQKLAEECFRLQTAHETGMMDTPGQPEAWSVYLAILSASRESAGHLEYIIKSLD